LKSTKKGNADVVSVEDKLEKALVPEAEHPYSIPQNWVWTRMGNITEIVGGGTPRSHDPALYENGTIPWIRPVTMDTSC
jgi:type I restriction enzyme S subunit